MRCPICKDDNTRVLDSRPWNNEYEVKRRRTCASCEATFTTFEKSEEIPLLVMKKDDTREPFDREKVRRGLQIACKKRPVSSESIEGILDELEMMLYAKNTTETTAQEIGEFLMKRLVTLDEVAYVRFASVYRRFRDVTQFADELNAMLEKIHLK